jgi:hypothetical protein
MSATEDVVVAERVDDVTLRGFSRPFTVFGVTGYKPASVAK